MKRIICICVTFIMLSLVGCSTKEIYELKEPQENIKSIEIGVMEEFTGSFESVKLLSESEISYFLEELKGIEFNSFFIGAPPDVYGLTVKITYYDETYEVICDHWSQYVVDGRPKEGWYRCEKEDFENLISKFYDIESDDES